VYVIRNIISEKIYIETSLDEMPGLI